MRLRHPCGILVSGMTRAVPGAGLQTFLAQRLGYAAQHLGARHGNMTRQQPLHGLLMLPGTEIAIEHHRAGHGQVFIREGKEQRKTDIAQVPRGGPVGCPQGIQQWLLDGIL